MTEFNLEQIGPEFPFPEGLVIPVDKPLGWTSTDVVRKIKVMLRRLGHRKIKIGHAGTLDPLATGVLLICIGRATKRVDELQAEEKEYLARIELGTTTPSYDLEHEIDQRYPWQHITDEQIRQTLEGFTGEQEQIPPLYSAKRLDGKRAYEYAREGETVKMRTALITIYAAELTRSELPKTPEVTVRLNCSKGTYVRSFARDLGERLDSGAHLTGLIRTKSGNYHAENCVTLEDLEQKWFGAETNAE